MLNLVLLEDNPADYTLFRLLLRDLGIQNNLMVFSTGEEIIDYLSSGIRAPKEYPSGVVLDLNVPKNGGHEVLAWMRSYPQLAGIPVAVLSSSKNEQDITEVERQHAAFFSKSGKFDEMKQIVRKIIALFEA